MVFGPVVLLAEADGVGEFVFDVSHRGCFAVMGLGSFFVRADQPRVVDQDLAEPNFRACQAIDDVFPVLEPKFKVVAKAFYASRCRAEYFDVQVGLEDIRVTRTF